MVLTRQQALAQRRCCFCGKPRGEFHDFRSSNEYNVSAMCQSCQDAFREAYPDSAWNVEYHDYGPKEEQG